MQQGSLGGTDATLSDPNSHRNNFDTLVALRPLCEGPRRDMEIFGILLISQVVRISGLHGPIHVPRGMLQPLSSVSDVSREFKSQWNLTHYGSHSVNSLGTVYKPTR